MRSLLIAFVALLCFTSIATAGPLRDWINDHRPGILIPKRDFIAPSPAPEIIAPGCPGGACPVRPKENIFRAQPFGVVILHPANDCPCGSVCPCQKK